MASKEPIDGGSDWLQELTRLIALPEGSRPVAHTRERIIRLVDQVLPNEDWIACLWLAEKRPKRNILTLWHLTVARSLQTPEPNDTFCVRSFPSALQWPGAYGSGAEVANAQKPAATQYQVSLVDQPKLRKCVLAALGQGFRVQPICIETLLPLFGPDDRKLNSSETPALIGLLQIITTDALQLGQRHTADQITQLMVLARGLSGRIAFSRIWRCIDALEEFQKRTTGVTDPQSLCQIAVDVICETTHAIQCILFRSYERSGLRAYAAASQPPLKVELDQELESLPESTLLAHLFDGRTNNGGNSVIRLLDVYDKTERDQWFPKNASVDNRYLAQHQEVCGKISWLGVRIDARGINSGNTHQVPLAILKLSAVPRPDYIGGALSETDERIAVLIASSLAELLPSLLFRHFVDQLAPFLRSATPEVEITSSEQLEEKILKTLQNFVPTICRAWDVERRGEARVRIRLPKASDGEIDPEVQLDKLLKLTHPSRIEKIGDRYYFSVSVVKLQSLERRLVVELSRPGLIDPEVSMIEHVASEMRLRQLGEVDVEAQLERIVELRHSLRHGLTGLINHVAVAQEIYDAGRKLSSEVARKLLLEGSQFRKLLESAAYAAAEVENLFESSRLFLGTIERNDLQLTLCDVAEIIRTIERNLRAEIDRRQLLVKFRDHYQRGDPRPVADQRLIRIALFNIIDNAVKYAHRGQSIDISLYPQSNRWYCSVEDVGRYIPEAEREAIFIDHFRLRASRGEQQMPGTGLGLPIALRIAHAHHETGKIEVESEPVQYQDGRVVRAKTTFSFHLPRDVRSKV